MAKHNSVGKTCLILLGIFLFMLLLNTWMPLHRDDYDYSMIWGTTRHIASLPDVFQSMVNHYMLHGGRMVTVMGLDLFLWLGKVWFDLANAAIFTGLMVLLYFHGMRRVSLFAEPKMLAAAAFLAWLCLPHFGEVAVWKSGSTVYLWSGFCAALFLLPYNLALAGRLRWGAAAAVPMFLLGIPAGWSVENLAVTVVAVTGLASLWMYRKGQGALWMPAGCIGALLGFVGILAAPGNYVRYGEQSQGKGILIHIGNQFAGNGEMLMYLLPMILLLLLVWRILKVQLFEKNGDSLTLRPFRFSAGQIAALVVIAVLVVSYFSGGFVSAGIRDFLIAHVLTPLHVTRPKTVAQFSHVMEGFEEMAIFWVSIFFLYSLAKQALGLDKKTIRQINEAVKTRDVWQAWPEVRYAGALIALCFINNFIMIAAPTFPARATFSSTCMVIIAVLAVLRIPGLSAAFAGAPRRILTLGGGAIALFLAVSAVLISFQLTREDSLRIAQIQARAGSGEVITLPPIELKNRALRHVFYMDFDNGITKGGVCRYYGIKDIHVQK